MKKETEIWLSIAEEDYRNMIIMKKEKSLRAAVLFAQQAVEKVLKGYICEIKNKTPRRTHFIEVLIKEAGLDLTEIDSPAVSRLSVAYEWARYRDLSNSHFKKQSDVSELLVIAETIYSWVIKKFKKL